MNSAAPSAAPVQAPVGKNSGELLRKTATIACFTGAGALCAAYAYYAVFSRFQLYDDEGFILISLKWFFTGHALYDQVYSCYQPGFYFIDWLIFSLSRLPLCHDGIRFLTLLFWIAGAGLNALTTYRLTRGTLLALLVLILSTRCLDAFANEPGHPEALCYLLVSALVALFTFPLPPRISALAGGILMGLLLLIKINIGCFTSLALLLVLAAANRRGRLAGIKGLVALLTILAPAILMHSRLILKVSPFPSLYLMEAAVVLLIGFMLFPQRWSFFAALALLVVCAVSLPSVDTRLLASLPFFSAWLLTFSICSAVMLCLALMPERPGSEQPWLWAALGIGGTVAVILLAMLLRGTSLQGLVQGLVFIPATVSQSAFVAWHSNSIGAWFALTGALACLLYLRRQVIGETAAEPGAGVALAKLAFGVLVLFEFYVREQGSRPLMPFDYRLPHFWMLPFAWLAAIAGSGGRAGKPGGSAERCDNKINQGSAGASPHRERGFDTNNPSGEITGRLVLVVIAVMQPLIAYPVAGTQLVPASMLLAIVAAVCLADAVREIAPKLRGSYVRPLRFAVGFVLASLLVLFFARETKTAARNYAALIPLNLPGAKRVRLPADQVRAFQELVEPLARPEVETFLTLPGLNSFYFWAEKESPTGLNAAWMTPLEVSAQEKIWEAARERKGLMVIRNRSLVRQWTRSRAPDQLPLLKHIEENFETMLTNGSYEVMSRRAEGNKAPGQDRGTTPR